MDQPTKVVADRRRRSRDGPSDWGDFLYDAFYGGAIGGSTVALVFLGIDAWKFEPLFTPSLLGSALFRGVDPQSVPEVRLDMVAAFTALHICAFLGLGLVISAAVQRMHELAFHPVIVSSIIFLLLHGGFVLADYLFLGGAVDVIGFWWVALANALTGASMGVFLLKAHQGSGTEYV